MKEELKGKISNALIQKMQDNELSQAAVARLIGGISDTVINFIVNKKWLADPQCVSDAMFNRVSSWLGLDNNWVICEETHNYKKVNNICSDAQRNSYSFAISAAPGLSKSAGAEGYFNTHPNSYYITCADHYTRRSFLERMMKAIGLKYIDRDIADMVERIVETLNGKNKPLFIIDEADKLSDRLLQFFITFYNSTYMNCGFVFIGSVHFEKKITSRADKNKQGYAEFYSRVGKEFVMMKAISDADVMAICKANGITESIEIQEVTNDAKNDLRRVKRAVETIRKRKAIVSPVLNGKAKKEGVAA